MKAEEDGLDAKREWEAENCPPAKWFQGLSARLLRAFLRKMAPDARQRGCNVVIQDHQARDFRGN